MVDRRTLDRPRGGGLVSHLAAHGVACVWADLRGHGQSGPRPEEGGDWGYDDLVEYDVPALVGFARQRFAGLPLTTVGHSLFGHVALAHLARHPDAAIDGLVLLAVNVAHPRWNARPLARVTKTALIEVMGVLTRAYGRLPARRLGYGTDDEPRGYVRDFVRIGRATRWRARDGFDYWEALPSVRRPLFGLVGSGDRWMAPAADARAIATRVPGAEFQVVGRRTGLSWDPDHMGLVLDPRSRPAWDQIAEFIRRVPAAPAPR
jgi:predicted alpha/beta hydrolase